MFAFIFPIVFHQQFRTNNTLFIDIKINGKIRKNKDYHRPVKLLKYTIEYIVAPGAYILAIRRSVIGNAKQKGFTYIAKTTITYSNIYIYICMCTYITHTGIRDNIYFPKDLLATCQS